MPDESNPIVDRCISLALTLARAQQLAKEEDVDDSATLARVLGLDPKTLLPLADRRWIWMAAQSASVSYREVMDEWTLVDAISSGQVPSKYSAHICTLLDEVSLQIVVMACSQVAQQRRLQMEAIWRNVAKLARLIDSRRALFWADGN